MSKMFDLYDLRFPEFGKEIYRTEIHIQDLYVPENNFCSTCGKYMLNPHITVGDEHFCSQDCSEYETI